MNLLTKIILVSSLTLTCGGVIAISSSISDHILTEDEDVENVDETYVISKDGYTLSVNKANLKFSLTKGNSVVNSSYVYENDENLTTSRKAFIESPLSIKYITSSGADNTFAIFDKQHEDTTKVNFTELSDGFKAKLNISDGNRAKPTLKISLDLSVRIHENGIKIEINNIEEDTTTSNKLAGLSLYPGLFNSYKLVDGYALIPDGSGALIDYSLPTNAQSILSLYTYDSDVGIMANNRNSTSSNILSLPMYAINVDETTLIANIESGSEYSKLNTKVAGITDDYNYTYFDFIFRDMYYYYQGISESTRKLRPQENVNDFDIAINYDIFDKKMEYYDVASAYQDYLINNNILNKTSDLESKVRLEFLMAENKDSMFSTELIKMSTTDFIKNSMSDLLNNGKNYEVSVFGYAKGGLRNSYPNNFPVESKIGDLKDLATSLNKENIDCSFIVDYIRSYEGSGVKTSSLAMNMSEKYISINDYNPGSEQKFNYLTLSETENRINGDLHYLSDYSFAGFDFTSLGNSLYSSYYNEAFTRKEAINRYKSILSNLNCVVGLRKPNYYTFAYLDKYLSLETSNSGFLMETESVPFMSMILSGYVNKYSSPINLNYIGEDQILKLVDFNINPTFLLTEQSAINLFNTSAEYIFSSKYDDWKDMINSTYSTVISALNEVSGAKFLSREKLDNNVYISTYSNNKQIIVNYSSSSYIYEGNEVSSKGVKVI